MNKLRVIWILAAAAALWWIPVFAAEKEYVLGPEDQIRIWAAGVDEITKDPYRVDPSGYVDLPGLGRVKAVGLTVEELRLQLLAKLAVEVRQPKISIDIVSFGSQPVSVMGAVKQPGVHQLNGRKTLAEVLALAGGLADDAGPAAKIVRRWEDGLIPLESARQDLSGKFSVAEVKLKDFLGAQNPAENIVIRAHDVITVPRAETIYVIGEVRRSGGFALRDQEKLSVLQVLALAEGLAPTASAQNAKILRVSPDGGERKEIAINLKKVMEGKANDEGLQANDVLFIPSSAPKKVGARVAEAAIQTLTGVVIWRRPGM
jgi:polysaccharide export outer membrane protein